jgi:hypothetical protein
MSSKRERVADGVMLTLGVVLAFGFAAAVGAAIAWSYSGEKGIHNAVGSLIAMAALYLYLKNK